MYRIVQSQKKGQYLVLTTYWKHAKYTDFCRNTTVVQRHDGSLLNHPLAQYFFTGEPHKVSLKKNRSNKPFHPTTSSTFQFINDNVRRPLAAGTVFDRAFEQARGVIALRIDSKNSLRLIRLPA